MMGLGLAARGDEPWVAAFPIGTQGCLRMEACLGIKEEEEDEEAQEEERREEEREEEKEEEEEEGLFILVMSGAAGPVLLDWDVMLNTVSPGRGTLLALAADSSRSSHGSTVVPPGSQADPWR